MQVACFDSRTAHNREVHAAAAAAAASAAAVDQIGNVCRLDPPYLVVDDLLDRCCHMFCEAVQREVSHVFG